jgi:hypothetical protein
MAVTPRAATNTTVATGSTPVIAFDANINGGLLQNPVLNTDQGIGTAEPLYVDPTGAEATLQGNGTTFRIEQGGFWAGIPGQTTQTTVNAATSGHKFSGIQY